MKKVFAFILGLALTVAVGACDGDGAQKSKEGAAAPAVSESSSQPPIGGFFKVPEDQVETMRVGGEDLYVLQNPEKVSSVKVTPGGDYEVQITVLPDVWETLKNQEGAVNTEDIWGDKQITPQDVSEWLTPDQMKALQCVYGDTAISVELTTQPGYPTIRVHPEKLAQYLAVNSTCESAPLDPTHTVSNLILLTE